MNSQLTVEMLMDAVAALGPLKQHRIIVGFPLVPIDKVAMFSNERLEIALLGRETWDAVRATARAQHNRDVEEMASAAGVHVEFFGDRDDHFELLRVIALSWAQPARR